MSCSNLFSILCFVLTVSFGYVSAAPRCGDSLFFRPNSTYDTNRRLVLSSLASNVSSRDGYYNVSVGEGPGRIYVLGLCIPGTDPTVCSDCIQPASVGLLENCPNQTDSWDWRADKTLCFVRYSNSSFFNKNDSMPTQAEYFTKMFEGDLEAYTRTWVAFMNFMITRVGQTHYLTDISSLIGSERIYALMQCIPGLTSEHCEICIRESVDQYQSCCNGYMGGSVRKPVCFFRWDGYAYLGAFNETPSPPTQESQPGLILSPPTHVPPPPPPLSTGAIVAIVLSTVIFVVLLVSGLVIWKKKQSYKTLKPQSSYTFSFFFFTILSLTMLFGMHNSDHIQYMLLQPMMT